MDFLPMIKKPPLLPDDPEQRYAMLKMVGEVAPYYKTLGMIVDHLEPGLARLSLCMRRELSQALGIMHGGAIASVADSAVALALLTTTGQKNRIVTVEFKINYLAPVVDGTVVAEAKILFKGRDLAYGEVDIRVGETLVARATSTYFMMPEEYE
jgi:uncharacterized protein (TIGR00369 family)